MKKILYRALSGLLLTLVCAAGFVSCTDNDDASALSGPVPVYLHVSADLLGDLNASRATDPYASAGEFMNTLCVFVCDANGEIEAKFGPDILDGYEDALKGNLTDWTSDRIVLDAGTYTIYAFSNWETADSENGDWAALIAKEVGQTIEVTDLYFTVDDPASKVDIANGKYIPMSGKEEVEVTVKDLNYNPELIEVGLDRLVGKVTITVQGETSTMVEGSETAQAVTIESLSFTGWADKVPMMSDDNSTYAYTYEEGYPVAYEESEGPVIAVGSTMQIASFYVNETTRPTENGGFGITMQTDRYGGVTYTATTVRTDIPRNHIYPILLTLDTYELQLTPTAWTSILGVDAEIGDASPITFEDDTYYITLLDVTSTFEITPSLTYSKGDAPTADWTWTYVDEYGEEIENPECTITTGDNGVLNVTKLTATPGFEYAFTLVGEWTANEGATLHSRTYNVKVVFTEGFPSSFLNVSRAWWSRSYGSEMVRLKVR